MLFNLVRSNRSFRRFNQSTEISSELLYELIDLSRYTASANNLQPLKYYLSNGKELNERIFSCLSWAAKIKEWNGPLEGERPSAYIVILGDNNISDKIDCDHGIVSQTILLGAVERGLGGCIIGSIDRKMLRRVLDLDPRYDILLVIALGEPAERVVIETVGENGDISYWRDAAGVHHVPKRELKELILEP